MSFAELLVDYDAFFASLDGGLLGLNAAVFEKATDLRARLNLRTPDALHLAAAIVSGCDIFLTNDQTLPTMHGNPHRGARTRGMKEEEMMDIADYLHRTLEAREEDAALAKIREEACVQQEIPAAILSAVRVDE